jgi:hypothetical protein
VDSAAAAGAAAAGAAVDSAAAAGAAVEPAAAAGAAMVSAAATTALESHWRRPAHLRRPRPVLLIRNLPLSCC